MSSTSKAKAKFGKQISYSTKENSPIKSTGAIPINDGITIRVVQVTPSKIQGHTVVNFEVKKRKDYYKELNKKLGEN